MYAVEQTALIGPLTHHVLDQAIAQCAEWRRSGNEMSVAVNLSMRQLESAVLEDQVVDWAVAGARITERPMSFKELTGFGPGAQSEQQPAQPSEVSDT